MAKGGRDWAARTADKYISPSGKPKVSAKQEAISDMISAWRSNKNIIGALVAKAQLVNVNHRNANEAFRKIDKAVETVAAGENL